MHLTNLITLVFFILMLPVWAISQVDRYKDKLSAKVYEEFKESENKLDTLKTDLEIGKLYLNLGRKAIRHNNEFGLEYELKAERYLKAAGHDSLYNMLFLAMGIPYINNGKFDSAQIVIEKSLDHWIKVKDTFWMSESYFRLGFLEKRRGRVGLAVKHFIHHKELRQIARPNANINGFYNFMGFCYEDLGEIETALSYYEKIIQYCEENNHKGLYSAALNNAGFVAIQLGYLDKAEEYLVKSFKERIGSTAARLGNGYNGLAELEKAKGKIAQSIIYRDSALHYFYKVGKTYDISEIQNGLYDLHKKEGNISKAFSYLKQAEANAIDSRAFTVLKSIYEKTSDYYEERGEPVKALEYLRKGKIIADSLNSEDTKKQLRAIEEQMVREKSDKEIALLEEQNLLKEKSLIQARQARNTLIGIIASLIAIVFLIVFLLRQRKRNLDALEQKNKTIEKALEERGFLLKEIHHRVKNNLAVISSLLGLQTRFISDENVRDALSAGRSRVQSMALLHKNLYTEGNLKGVEMNEYFGNLVQNLFDTYNLNDKKISFKKDIENINLDIDTVVPLGLVTNELISNSLKHAFKGKDNGKIYLGLHQKGNKLVLEVSDNGVGLPNCEFPETAKSLGVELIKSFTTKLDAEMIINCDEGTSIKLIIDDFQIVEKSLEDKNGL